MLDNTNLWFYVQSVVYYYATANWKNGNLIYYKRKAKLQPNQHLKPQRTQNPKTSQTKSKENKKVAAKARCCTKTVSAFGQGEYGANDGK